LFYNYLFKAPTTEVINLLLCGRIRLDLDSYVYVWQRFFTKNLMAQLNTLTSRVVTECNHRTTPSHFLSNYHIRQLYLLNITADNSNYCKLIILTQLNTFLYSDTFQLFK